MAEWISVYMPVFVHLNVILYFSSFDVFKAIGIMSITLITITSESKCHHQLYGYCFLLFYKSYSKYHHRVSWLDFSASQVNTQLA
jgi:hypothetical protein